VKRPITISRHNIEYQSSIGILLLLTEDYLTGKVASVSQYSKSLTVHSHVKRFSTSFRDLPQRISKHHPERSSKIRILHSISRIMCISLKISIFVSLASVLYLGYVAGLSFEDSEEGRENYYNFIVESRAKGKTFDGTEVRGKCKDNLRTEICRKYKPLCTYFKIVRQVCAESCGKCERANHPVPCQASKYGCCWDNFTRALGPQKEGCPACNDMHKDCKYLKDRCAERAAVRRVCPVTCGVKCEGCEDDLHQADVCPYYKAAGFCEIDPDLMKKHCKKTCRFCR